MIDNGAAVLAHGRISLYATRGELQLYVDLVQPEGTGPLHRELERLKVRLEEEGLFDPSRKRPLPVFPRKIGVVTSETGAVFHDICTVIQRRYPLVEVVLAPAAVQGRGAAAEIVDSLRTLNDRGDIDVILVARGGGSLEELWPFNEEVVARAVYGSRRPIISGVGHETDTTISDLVADRRAATPSAAAELAVPDVRQLRLQVATHQRATLSAVTSMLQARQDGARGLGQRLQWQAPPVDALRQRVDDLAQALVRDLGSSVKLARERFQGLAQHLEALSPHSVLERGYALVQLTEKGAVVTSTAQVTPDDALSVTVQDGSFGARVV